MLTTTYLQPYSTQAYQTEEDQVLNGQEIPKGYWLFPAQWYKLVQTSQRAYVVLAEKIQLNVNAMVRLPAPIEFEQMKVRKQPQGPTPAPLRVQPGRAAAQPIYKALASDLVASAGAKWAGL